jgi:hypothetical protein
VLVDGNGDQMACRNDIILTVLSSRPVVDMHVAPKNPMVVAFVMFLGLIWLLQSAVGVAW